MGENGESVERGERRAAALLLLLGWVSEGKCELRWRVLGAQGRKERRGGAG